VVKKSLSGSWELNLDSPAHNLVTVLAELPWGSKSYPFNRPRRPTGLRDVKAPTFSRQSAHRWRWGCQPYAPVALYPPGRFLVLIYVRGWVDPRTIVWLEGLGQLKNPMTSLGIEPVTLQLVAYWLDINFKLFRNFTLNSYNLSGHMVNFKRFRNGWRPHFSSKIKQIIRLILRNHFSVIIFLISW
jgi:hypothetical protein